MQRRCLEKTTVTSHRHDCNGHWLGRDKDHWQDRQTETTEADTVTCTQEGKKNQVIAVSALCANWYKT